MRTCAASSVTPRITRPPGALSTAPTFSCTDILYTESRYELPLDLEIGDPIDFLSAGAYTASCAAVEFNGLPPIKSSFV